MANKCSEKIKAQIRESSAKYWATQCKAADIPVIKGEAPQNTRYRIREAQKAAEDYQYFVAKAKKPTFMDYFLGRVKGV